MFIVLNIFYEMRFKWKWIIQMKIKQKQKYGFKLYYTYLWQFISYIWFCVRKASKFTITKLINNTVSMLTISHFIWGGKLKNHKYSFYFLLIIFIEFVVANFNNNIIETSLSAKVLKHDITLSESEYQTINRALEYYKKIINNKFD